MTSPKEANKKGGKKEISPQFSPTGKIFLGKSNRKYFFRQKRKTPPQGVATTFDRRKWATYEASGMLYSPMWRTWRGVRSEKLFGRAVRNMGKSPKRPVMKPKNKWITSWCLNTRKSPATPPGGAQTTPVGASQPPTPTLPEKRMIPGVDNNNGGTPGRVVRGDSRKELFNTGASGSQGETSPGLGVNPMYSPISSGSLHLSSGSSKQWRSNSRESTRSYSRKNNSTSPDSPGESYQGVGSPPGSPVIETLGSSPLSVVVLEEKDSSPFVPRVESMSATLMDSSEEERDRDRAWKRSFFESTRRMISEYKERRKNEFRSRAIEELQRAYHVINGVYRESIHMDHADKTPTIGRWLEEIEELVVELRNEKNLEERRGEMLEECSKAIRGLDEEERRRAEESKKKDSPGLD